MIIKNNMASLSGCRSLNKNNLDNVKAVRKLTSGIRINYAADDASGLGISEKMRSQIKGLDQGSVNTQDGIALVQTIEGATTEVHDILHRMTSLSIQASNGTLRDEDRELADKEIQQLKQEIDRISKDTEYNGKKVLDGSYGTNGERLDIQVGENPGFIISFKPIESIACDSLGIHDLNVKTQDDAQKALSALSKAINDVSSRRVDLGSVQNRLQHSVKSVDNTSENVTASESRIRDTNMAYEAMESVKSNILINSTEAMIVQANHDPEYVLTLLNEK